MCTAIYEYFVIIQFVFQCTRRNILFRDRVHFGHPRVRGYILYFDRKRKNKKPYPKLQHYRIVRSKFVDVIVPRRGRKHFDVQFKNFSYCFLRTNGCFAQQFFYTYKFLFIFSVLNKLRKTCIYFRLLFTSHARISEPYNVRNLFAPRWVILIGTCGQLYSYIVIDVYLSRTRTDVIIARNAQYVAGYY